MDKLINIISNLGSPKIMVIGDLMLDKYVWGEVKRISQEAPIPIINVSSEDVRPGGAGSVVNNMKMRFMGHLQTAGKGVQQLLRVDYEKTHVISAEIETQLKNYLNKTIQSCDVVLVSDMNKGLLSHSFLKTIVTLCKKHKKIAIADPKLVNDYSCYEGFTAMTPNRNETELATDRKSTRLNS